MNKVGVWKRIRNRTDRGLAIGKEGMRREIQLRVNKPKSWGLWMVGALRKETSGELLYKSARIWKEAFTSSLFIVKIHNMAWRLTRNHEEIKEWAQKHKGRPEIIDSTNGDLDEVGLRLDFPGEADEAQMADSAPVEGISWHEFFKKFEELGLAFEYETQESEDQDPTLLFRFVKRNPPDPEEEKFEV